MKFGRSVLKPLAVVAAGLILGIGTYRYKKNTSEKQVLVKSDGVQTLVRLGEMQEESLLDLRSNVMTPLPKLGHESHRLLIFLSGSDCGACLTILDKASELAKLRPAQLEVDFVIVHSSEHEARQVLASMQRTYVNTFLDAKGSAAERANLPMKTPVAVLVDAEFRVLLAEGPASDPQEQEQFISEVTAMTATSRTK